jgi:peptidoglycan-N-acetylglucosamine deacetylase
MTAPLLTPASVSVAAIAAAGGAVIAGALYGTFVPSSRFWGSLLIRGPATGSPRIALTFDDGPTEPFTGEILDILHDQSVKATFFVVGKNIQRGGELPRRIDTEGHLIGNHSYDHSHSGYLGLTGYWDRQIGQTDAIIERITGRRPALFRPPMGIKTCCVAAAARRRGHVMVNWTRRAMDGINTTPQKILDRLVPSTQPGEILLLHDGIEPNSTRDGRPTVQALPKLIEGLRQRGFSFARLDELLGIPPYQPDERPAPHQTPASTRLGSSVS